MTERSPLGPAIESLAGSYKQLLNATLALNVAEIPYAICGGFAVAVWCLHHEQQLLAEAPTKGNPKPITLINTKDVDVLISRKDLDGAIAVMERAGFHKVTKARVPMFVRISDAGRKTDKGEIDYAATEGIHLLFAGETSDDLYLRTPDPELSTVFKDTFWESDHTFRVLNIEEVVKTKLNSVSQGRLKDLIHLVELWESGAITDEIIQRVAFDPQWFEGDRIRRFHTNFGAIISACSNSGLRRYAMRGKEIAEQLDGLLAKASAQASHGGHRAS